MTTTRRRLFFMVALAPVIFSLHGQNTNFPFKAPKGLVVTSSVLDPGSKVLTTTLQNTSGKTIVAYIVFTTPFDAQGNSVNPKGQGYDFLDPDAPSSNYIQPNQSRVETVTLDPQVVSAKVEVHAVVYLDQTYEGVPGAVSAILDARKKSAENIRKSILNEVHTPEEQAKLEKRAAFYEASASAKEVQ